MMCAEMPFQVSGAIKETDPAELIQLTLVGLHGYVTLAVEPLQLSTFKKTVHEIPNILRSGQNSPNELTLLSVQLHMLVLFVLFVLFVLSPVPVSPVSRCQLSD